MFSNTYFLLHVYGKIMKLIHKITFSMHICFSVQGGHTFTINFNSSKYGSILRSTVEKWLIIIVKKWFTTKDSQCLNSWKVSKFSSPTEKVIFKNA
jgi:hypothetical protein